MSEPQPIVNSETPTDKIQLQGQIADADWKVRAAKEEKKTAAEMVKDHVEAMPEWADVSRLHEELEKARERLNEAKLKDPELENMMENLQSKTSAVETANLILSGLCIQYTTLHRVRSVEIDQENREIKLSAKIGRKIKQQMELPL